MFEKGKLDLKTHIVRLRPDLDARQTDPCIFYLDDPSMYESSWEAAVKWINEHKRNTNPGLYVVVERVEDSEDDA